MNEVLKDFIGKCVIVYLDDILIFSHSKEENTRLLRLVLKRLQGEKLLTNLNKSSFMKIELVFLGFLISQEGLKMDLEKFKEIVEWTSPRNIYEVISFHDLEIFDKRFIRNLSSICAPIVETVKKEYQPFEWIEAT